MCFKGYHRFKGTWDLFQSDVVRHVYTSRTVMKEEVYTHRSLDTGDTGHQCRATQGGTKVGRRQRQIRGAVWPTAFFWDFVGKSGQDRMDMEDRSKLRIGKFE